VEETPAQLIAKPSWLLTQVAVHAHRLAPDGFGEMGARGYHHRILAAPDEFGEPARSSSAAGAAWTAAMSWRRSTNWPSRVASSGRRTRLTEGATG
jgi:hypothetical protein